MIEQNKYQVMRRILFMFIVLIGDDSVYEDDDEE